MTIVLKRKTAISVLTVLMAAALTMSAQSSDRADSLVRLMSAKSVQLIEDGGRKFRQVTGPARFLHNNTYLVCDTAIWKVDEQVINAMGNVQLIQDETVLSSDKLDYFVDQNLAEFRGTLVQLVDKDQNLLRTRHLDYNTKDSVAVFARGASMKDKDGQIIESLDGTYDSKTKVFTFVSEVNMFTDSVFVKTDELIYEANPQVANFRKGVDAWQDDKMLSAEEGYYDRCHGKFSFFHNVHLLSDTQEGWADTIYVFQETGDMMMRHEAQLHDTSRGITGMGDAVDYTDSSSLITARLRSAIAIETNESDRVDTVFFGGDTLRYWTRFYSDIPVSSVKEAEKRLSDLNVDSVTEYRRKAAKAAAEAAAAAAAEADAAAGKKDMGPDDIADGQSVEKMVVNDRRQPVTLYSLIEKIKGWFKRGKGTPGPAGEGDAPADSLLVGGGAAVPDSLDSRDSLDVSDGPAGADSTGQTDSLTLDDLARILYSDEENPDTTDGVDHSLDSLQGPGTDSTSVADSTAAFDSTKIGFIEAVGNVKVFRETMQVICDSLVYCDLDSLTRLFKDPIVWNEGSHQYRSDSLAIVLEDGHMKKANLNSNAFVIIQEDTAVFDQIKGVEMMAYFDTAGTMTRYDVLGGASALFYLQENDAWATANKAESKMLSVNFVDGQIDRVFYYDTPHNDAYPVVQLPSDLKQMKGFSWQPELRPRGPWEITTIELRPSQRSEYESRPRTVFKQTDRFFPGYMASVYEHIAYRDSMKVVNKHIKDSLEVAAKLAFADSLASEADSIALADSLAFADSLKLADSLAVADSLALADSLAAVRDGIGTVKDSLASVMVADSLSAGPVDEKAAEAARKAAARQQKKEAREAARKARIEAREARWAALDAKDAEKAAAKEAKTLERQRARTRRILDKMNKQAAKDQQKLDRYIERYRKRMPETVEDSADANLQTESPDSELPE